MKRSDNKLPFILAGLVAVFLIFTIAFIFTQSSSTTSNINEETSTEREEIAPLAESSSSITEDKTMELTIEQQTENKFAQEAKVEDQKPVVHEIDSAIDDKPQEEKTFSPVDEAFTNLDNFFVYLDQQEYIQTLNLPLNSRDTFSTLVQKLIDNPPVVSGEADDLFTLLKNTAHFFRILGENHIVLLKQIFINETEKIEKLSADLYIVLNHHERLEEHYGIAITDSSLYEYSSFFMNTMGGRLYMFRRDMEIRMLVSYYSILFVEEAEEKGLNNHGLDISPFVTTLIKEIENHGQKLDMRYRYLETLYEIDQRSIR